MPQLHRLISRAGLSAALLLGGATLGTHRLSAQVPVQGQPTPDQARQMLRNQPEVVRQLRQRLAQSGLTPDQVRSRLRAAGYPETLLDEYLQGADTTRAARPGPRTFDAVRALGILSGAEADSLEVEDSVGALSDSLLQVLDSLRAMRADSARADSLADSVEVLRPQGLKVFGLQTFRRTSTRFQAVQSGPVDENYRLGPGDML